jgi:ComF family protein
MSIVESLRDLFAATSGNGAMNTHTRRETLRKRLANRVLPARCVLCADACMQVVCAPCEGDLVRVASESCPRCKLPSSNSEVCGRCLRFPPKWEQLSATFMYEFPLNRLIVGAKHGRHWGTFDWAAGLIDDWPFAASNPSIPRHARDELSSGRTGSLLIPVPASPERLTERGYNQATLLAQSLAKRFSLRVDNEAIVRIRETGTQANRNWVERRRNVKHAFAATRSLAGESVVLVDDVLTTGATLNECARAALDSGAARVDAFVIARVNPQRASARIQKFNRVVS